MVLDDLFNNAVILLATVLPFILVPFILWVYSVFKTFWIEFEQSAPGEIIWLIESAARHGVGAAEQLYKSGIINPEARLDKAIESAESYLETIGYQIDLDVLKDAIEATVAEINRYKDTPS